MGSARVALVNMPFAPADRASVQIAILKAVLDVEGIDADEMHANLDFFDLLRQQDVHHAYSSTMPALIGEWLFAREPPPPADDVARAALDVDHPLSRLAQFAAQWGASYQDLVDFREDAAGPFIQRLLAERDWSHYDIVAFTLTYPQLNASFWLADELKARHPHLTTVFGGAQSLIHLGSAAEYTRAYPFVDCFVVGEAEGTFNEVCRVVLEGGSIAAAGLPGVVARDEGGAVVVPASVALIDPFDDAPFPDYRGFAAKRATLPAATRALIHEDIPVEMARGCVWAVKKVCSFCGFYPDGGYRRKSNEVALRELRAQRDTLGWSSFYSLDAYIPNGLVTGVFRRIPDEVPGITFPFIELRTRMKRPDLEALARAGVTLVQPGIECLEDGLLDKIDKGVSLQDNLLFMKWSLELGLEVSWNLLLALPEATEKELRRQLDVIERIAHLPPPSPTRLLFVRASSYHLRPERYGLSNLRPDPFYPYVHPPHVDIAEIAYELVADHDMTALLPLWEETARAVNAWRERWRRGAPRLTASREGADVVVIDGREDGVPEKRVTLSGPVALVVGALAEDALGAESVSGRTGLASDVVDSALGELERAGFVLESKGRFIPLVIFERQSGIGERVVATQRRWSKVAKGGGLSILGQEP